MNTIFYENIESLIRLKNITQEELAINSGLSRQTINKVIGVSQKNSGDIKLNTAIEIAKALDVDFPTLFSRINTKELNNLKESTYQSDSYLDIFIQNIKRQTKGRQQNSLSTEPGLEESTISNLFTGKTKNPKLSTCIYIAEILGVEIQSLFTRGGVKFDI